MQETGVQSLGQEDPLEKEMAAHSSILAGKSHGHRSLVGCSPWGAKELGMTEQLTLNLSEVTHPAALTLNFAFKHSSLFGSF